MPTRAISETLTRSLPKITALGGVGHRHHEGARGGQGGGNHQQQGMNSGGHGDGGEDGEHHLGGGRVRGELGEEGDRQADEEDEDHRRHRAQPVESFADEAGQSRGPEAVGQGEASPEEQYDVPRQPPHHVGPHHRAGPGTGGSGRDQEEDGGHGDGHGAVVDQVTEGQEGGPAGDGESADGDGRTEDPEHCGQAENGEDRFFLEADFAELAHLRPHHAPVDGDLPGYAEEDLGDQGPGAGEQESGDWRRHDEPNPEGQGRRLGEGDLEDALQREVGGRAHQGGDAPGRAGVGDPQHDGHRERAGALSAELLLHPQDHRQTNRNHHDRGGAGAFDAQQRKEKQGEQGGGEEGNGVGDPPGGHEQSQGGHAGDLRLARLQVEPQGEREQKGADPQADALAPRPGLRGWRERRMVRAGQGVPWIFDAITISFQSAGGLSSSSLKSDRRATSNPLSNASVFFLTGASPCRL